MRTCTVASCNNMYLHHHFLLFSKCLVNQFSLLMLRILSTTKVIIADKSSESYSTLWRYVKNISSSIVTIFHLKCVMLHMQRYYVVHSNPSKTSSPKGNPFPPLSVAALAGQHTAFWNTLPGLKRRYMSWYCQSFFRD